MGWLAFKEPNRIKRQQRQRTTINHTTMPKTAATDLSRANSIAVHGTAQTPAPPIAPLGLASAVLSPRIPRAVNDDKAMQSRQT